MNTQSKNKTYGSRNRFKTMCPLDSSDSKITYFSKEKENYNQNTNNSAIHDKSQIQQKAQSSKGHKNNSQYQTINLSGIRKNATTNLLNKSMSNQDKWIRLKTDYSEYGQKFLRLSQSCYKKNPLLPYTDIPKSKKIKINSQSPIFKDNQCFNTKKQQIKLKFSTMRIKSTNKRQKHQENLNILQKLQTFKKKKEKQPVLNIYKQDNKQIVTTQKYGHVTWKNNKYDNFVKSLKDSNNGLLNIIKKFIQTIIVYSRNGYVCNNIRIESLCFPIIKGNLKLNNKIKIGGLFNHFSIKNKQQFLLMPIEYRTPPEILNLISFNNGDACFDRDSLQYITSLNQGWKIDFWALGILILELLNGGPLQEEDCKLDHLIGLEKNILLQYSQLIDQLNNSIKSVLTQILSYNPNDRLHPNQILQILSK